MRPSAGIFGLLTISQCYKLSGKGYKNASTSVNHCHLCHPSSELMEHSSCQDIHLSLYHISVLPLPRVHHSASTLYLLLSTMTTSGRPCLLFFPLVPTNKISDNLNKRAITLVLSFILSLLSFILHLSREAWPKASSRGVHPHSLVNSHFGVRGSVNSNNIFE